MGGGNSDAMDLFSARNMLLGVLTAAAVWLAVLPASPAQGALWIFFCAAMAFEWFLSRGQLAGLSVERRHVPRAFEGDGVEVILAVSASREAPVQLLRIEDLFMASLDVHQRQLIPWMASGWRVLLPYSRQAERHHGLYLIGPVRARSADPLGIFFQQSEIGTITRLTVYPKADPLPEYRVPGEQAPPGASMDLLPRVGQGEEILAVREYHRGDSPSRIHWRTSARRGSLHTLQLNQPVQAELLLLLDMSRAGRYGLGGEATPRMAVAAAVSILTRGHESRHRLAMSYTQAELVNFPSGSGLAHLHLLLDRLVLLEPAGDAPFWPLAMTRATLLPAGSRAVFIVTGARTPPGAAEAVRQLVQCGVSVDCVLIDERAFIKIYHDQEEESRQADKQDFVAKAEALRRAGARAFELRRGQPSFADELERFALAAGAGGR